MKLIAATLVLAFLLGTVPSVSRKVERLLYPCKYSSFVQVWSTVYELDPLLVYSVIRTESGFDPYATSSVDARGLMQMTEETFFWLRGKIAAEEHLTFDDLYNPAVSIRFGCYYLNMCLARYGGDVDTAAAAYHSGWGTVDALLTNPAYSSDGITLKSFPYSQMNHYVEKIRASYDAYQRLYPSE
ncbi:MAG: lytic transglycosylase domain-containing protein [Faecalibacterium sp.]